MEYAVFIAAFLQENAPMLIGFILPPFVEILNKNVYGRGERFFVSVLTCVIVALLLHWPSIESGDPEAVTAYFLLLLGESQAVFKLYFGESYLRYAIQKKVSSVHLDDVQEPLSQ